MTYDLILRGGRVIDPSQKLDEVIDIGFLAGKVSKIGPGLKSDAGTAVRDVSGYTVTPGLVDLHTHVYWGGTSLGIDAEEFCRQSGVTTAVDTGSAGPGNSAPCAMRCIDPPANNKNPAKEAATRREFMVLSYAVFRVDYQRTGSTASGACSDSTSKPMP